MQRSWVVLGLILAIWLAAGPAVLVAQAPEPQDAAQKQPFKPEELEQIVAPIALYPDSLLAQIFMASTYPLEIVQAARWSKEHPQVKGDAVAKEMEKQTWDASVKSLVAFPDVLTMMNEKLDWTQKLGDAFLAQQKDVMDAVQRLRVKAKEAGNLKSGKEQTVKTEAAPAGAPAPQIIIIESKDPEVVYVPTYNPTVVYGAWPYPAYPPYYYYPPYYAPGAAFFSFSVGVVVGGAIWGNCNWGGNDIDIDVNAPIFGGDREQGGGLNLTAGQNVHVNDYIVTNNGAVNLTATAGTVTIAPDKAVFAGTAPISVNAAGTIHTGPLVTNGSLAIRSLAGSVAVDAFIDEHTGPVSIKAAAVSTIFCRVRSPFTVSDRVGEVCVTHPPDFGLDITFRPR